MPFTRSDKLKALAIVNVFETSKPFGDYAACVVLNDGAGISYGIAQFTHRSGSLLAVVEAYLAAGGAVGAQTISECLPQLRQQSGAAIKQLAANTRFKNALRAAASTAEMQAAQRQVATDKYLLPAVRECERRGFMLPLSLAVLYDSMVHGSWERVAAMVTASASRSSTPIAEKGWILEYLRKRHLWLSNIPRLRATTYRTKFFLGQVAVGNWDLKFPFSVHGVRLTAAMFPTDAMRPGEEAAAASSSAGEQPGISTTTFASAGEQFDRVESVISSAVRRTDAAKSLWTTVAGTVWQAAWGVFGFVAGLPREIWIVVAVIAAALMLFYLYRQITLAKIRESRTDGSQTAGSPT